jgi:anaerobic selenocysteine-containing dehydrogenase
MSMYTGDAKRLDRRGFLKGSALFAAAAAVAAAAPAAAQEAPPTPAPEEKKEEPKTDDPAKKKPLIDKDGREYRVCDMCGANMYKDGKVWTCEQCGFSYEE